MMIPPFEQKPFCEMTKADAETYFNWYIAEKDKRIKQLIDYAKSEGVSAPLDFSVDSLNPIWEWYVTKISYREKSSDEIKEEAAKYPEWMHDFILQKTISYETWMYGMDVALYFAEVFIRNNGGKIYWGYFTKPKNRSGVNQPTLLGFNHNLDLNPRTIVANCTRTFYKEKNTRKLYDIYYIWLKDV